MIIRLRIRLKLRLCRVLSVRGRESVDLIRYPAKLFAAMSDFERRAAVVAVACSIGVHLLGVLVFVLLLVSGAMHKVVAKIAAPEEQVLLRPEMLLVEEDPAPELRFLKSDEHPDVEPVPDIDTISDADSRAATDAAVDTVVMENEIALDGEVEHGWSVLNREFIDRSDEGGPAGGDNPPPPAPESVSAEIPDQLLREDPPSSLELLGTNNGELIPVRELPGEQDSARVTVSENTVEHPPRPEPAEQSFQQEADTGFSHETRQRKLRGTLSNQGTPSFDAKATPTGRYLSRVTQAIERKWRAHVDLNREFVTWADLRVTFKIDKDGMVHDLKIPRAEANAVIKDFTLSAILEAELPPIPADLWEILEGEQIEMSYDIVIY